MKINGRMLSVVFPAIAGAAALAGMALAAGIERPKVKPELDVPSQFAVLLKAPAHGVQIYTCHANGAQFTWSAATPDALLTDYGNIVLHHYKGPNWEAADGSKITGIVPPAASDSPDPNAIPWLKLQATGTGKFAKVGWVQRVETEGGKAPATGCDSASVGKEARIDYKAVYFFYTAK
jgi:hypothetical protein